MTQTGSYDLAVIGGGPAGSSAAIAAARFNPKAKILLLERGRYPRHKVCGEFLSPEGVQVLHSLCAGCSPAEDWLRHAIQITKTRLYLDGQKMQAPLHPPALSITRYDLDSVLWKIAEAERVECCQQVTVNAITRDRDFTLSTGTGPFRAAAVINASGRWSNLVTRPVQANGKAKWIGLKAHYLEATPHPSVDLYFFAGGYCGVQPVGKDRVNACAMVRADVAINLQQVFALSPELERRTRQWQLTMDPVSTSPLLFCSPTAVQDGLLNVGDAAGFIDPFVGNGITLALRSGAVAAEALTEFLSKGSDPDSSLKHYRRLYERTLAPAFTRASRVRQLLTLPRIVRSPLIAAVQLSGTAEYLVRHTRS